MYAGTLLSQHDHEAARELAAQAASHLLEDEGVLPSAQHLLLTRR